MRQLTILFLIFSKTTLGQAEKFVTIGKYDKFFSNILNSEREIIVHVPTKENDDFNNETYPVLFLLDGENLFIKTVGILNHLSSPYGGEKCPEMIIVGITHPDRMKDLLPVIGKGNSNEDKFTEFLEKELIPYIDKNYPTQPYRVLVGHSLGGLRTANTLVYHPQIFNSYIALDPSLGHDMNVWSFKTDSLLKNKKFDNRSLFVAMAQTMPSGMDTSVIRKDTSGAARHMRAIMRFCNGINNYNVTGLNFKWKYYPDEAHAGVTFTGLYDGVNSLFSWYYNKDYRKIFDPAVSKSEALKIVTNNYDIISKNMGYTVLPREQNLDNIISYLRRKDMSDKALAFAELYVKYYPNNKSANLTLKEILWSKKKSLNAIAGTKSAQFIYKLCLKESKKADPDYNISEDAINELGYELVRDKKLNDALIIFKLNTELYPSAYNTWDSYGECLLLLGKETDGLQAYRKSLDLDPNNKNAERILQKHSPGK
jgi:uncharacterized protein